MIVRNIYISTYTTFDLIRILWNRQNELDACPKFRLLRQWLLKREMKQIIKGFLSRELTSQSNALMNILIALNPARTSIICEDLTITNGALYINIWYEKNEMCPIFGSVLYDAKKQTFTTDIEPTPNARNGLKFTIEFGQKAPSSIMDYWQTTIVPLIEQRYEKVIARIVKTANF